MPIIIEGDEVVKRQRPDRAAREFDKTRAAYELACTTRMFRVPEPLHLDESTGEIRFERLIGYKMLRDVLPRAAPDTQRQIMRRTGELLALIHSSLSLPAERRLERVPESSLEEARPLHGDFTLENILFCDERNEFAIVDWSMGGWLDYDACIGPVTEDVAGMLISIFNQRLIQRGKLGDPDFLADTFLCAYGGAHCASLSRVLRDVIDQKLRIYSRSVRARGYLDVLLYTRELRRLRHKSFDHLENGGVSA